MSASLPGQIEVAKLARVLGVETGRLQALATLDASDVRALRHHVADALVAADRCELKSAPKGASYAGGVTPVDPSRHDRFFLSQRIRPMINQYEVSTLGSDEKSAGEQVCFVEQKRMKLKEDLRAFTDDSKATEVFRIKAQQVWDPRARYDVTDPAGQHVGQLGKVFGKSLLRSTWRIYDADGNEAGWARERNLFVALFRRLVGLVPFVGEFANWLPIPYHFDYFVGEERIGSLERILGVRDRYRLDVSGDAERTIDRRVVLALAVGMDALQAR